MHVGQLIICILMLLVWCVPFGFAAYFSFRDGGRGRWFGVIGSLLIVWGIGGLILPQLYLASGATWMSNREWPAGWVPGVLTTPSGMHIAPAGLGVQVYDANWQFVRGWPIDSRRGVYKLRLLPDDRIEVLTARGSGRFTYDLQGNLIDSSTYTGNLYDSIPDQGESVWISTAPWKWTMMHPLAGFGAVALGIVVLVVGGKARVNFGRKSWSLARAADPSLPPDGGSGR